VAAPGSSAYAYERLLRNLPVLSARPVRDPKDTLYLFYTSGTTGRPKGVMLSELSERSIACAIETYHDAVRFTPSDRYLHTVSLGHRTAIGYLSATLFAGGCVCLADFELKGWLSRLETERISVTALVPTSAVTRSRSRRQSRPASSSGIAATRRAERYVRTRRPRV